MRHSCGAPPAPIGVDRLISGRPRLVNLIGKGLAASVAARWVTRLEVERLQRALRRGPRFVEALEFADEPLVKKSSHVGCRQG